MSERRLFELDDDVNGVYWTIPFATNQQGLTSTVSIDGVSITDYAEGGEPRSFQRVDAAENGQDGVYTTSTDNEALELKVFTPHEDGDVFYATVDYTLTGAVMAWSDTAELYWQFIGPDWEDDSEIVACSFVLTAPPTPESRRWREGTCGRGAMDPSTDR